MTLKLKGARPLMHQFLTRDGSELVFGELRGRRRSSGGQKEITRDIKTNIERGMSRHRMARACG
jgi:hypothetical protein